MQLPPRARTWTVGLGLHLATVAVALVAVVCLTVERRAMSGTFDESNHLAAGLEWWQFGTYTMWTENPPLPRLAVAALPYLHGMRLPARAEWEPKTHDWDRSWQVGTDLLYAGDGFEQNLARARLGILPFFLLALASAWALAGGRRRPLAGFVAVGLTATLPSLVAHGALATTDVAFAGTFLLATLALARWCERPSVPRALALGAAAGLGLLCKLSMLAFFPVVAACFAGARALARLPIIPAPNGAPAPSRSIGAGAQLGIAVFGAALMTWAGYLFSVGRVDAFAPEVKDWLQLLPPVAERHGLTGWLLRTPMPMPELVHGIRFLMAHDAAGHDAYLLGHTSKDGFLAFYPLALLVKAPLPLLIVFAAALPFLRGRRPELWLAQGLALSILGLLVVSLRSHVNLGIRHVFVVLPLAAVAAARVLDGLVAGPGAGTSPVPPRVRRFIAAGLVVVVAVQTGTLLASHGRLLGSFNVLAGRDPATVLLDSDLDWGQDLFALRRELRSRNVNELKIAFFGTLRLCRHELPPLTGLIPGQPATGWIAISENYYRHRSTFMLLKNPCDPKSTYARKEVPPTPFAWLRAHTPVVIAGSSVRLYYIDPVTAAALPAAAMGNR